MKHVAHKIGIVFLKALNDKIRTRGWGEDRDMVDVVPLNAAKNEKFDLEGRIALFEKVETMLYSFDYFHQFIGDLC